jgi:hypothetical protein
MKTITLYAQKNPVLAMAQDYQKILTSAGPIFIRAYVRTGPENNLLTALDNADPSEGEIVLNTIEAPIQ